MNFNSIMNRLKSAYSQVGTLNAAQNPGLKHNRSYQTGLNYDGEEVFDKLSNRSSLRADNSQILFKGGFGDEATTPGVPFGRQTQEGVRNYFFDMDSNSFTKGVDDNTKLKNIGNTLFGNSRR